MDSSTRACDDANIHEIGVRVALEAGYGVVKIEDDGRPFDLLDARGPLIQARIPVGAG
jgi:hypothetical protein